MAQTRDPEHWLYRLTSEEWLVVARKELVQVRAAEAVSNQRKAVANGRRAAGMALNAVLVASFDESWGRSYMDHLRAIAADDDLESALKQAARQLLDTPMQAPKLIGLGGAGSQGIEEAATAIVTWCERRLVGPS